MKYCSLLLFLLLGSCSIVEPEPDKLLQLSKSQKLYSCYYFFNATAESTNDLLLKGRLTQISNSLLLQAKEIALEVGGERINEKISTSGKQDFEEFMNITVQIFSRDERNQKFMDFSQSCADYSGIILNAG